MRLASNDDIAAAARRLDGRIVPTPLLASPRLSQTLGLPVSLKAENLQHTGSFKVRGVLNALLSRQERGDLPRGVTTFSAGNHAAATAFAANALGLPSVVCMPHGAVVTKVEAVRRYGGDIVFTDDLLGTCQEIARDRGYELLHPFDDPDVIAGQGTVGAELVRDAPDVGLVLVPVGGGGLISGVAAAVKATLPGARVIGVEPVTANAMSHALRTGTPAPLPHRPVSIADGLAAPFAGEHTLAHVHKFVDDVVELPEEAILPAWWELLDASKLLVEPSAAVGLAALRSNLVDVRPGTPTVLVLSGGNVAPAGLARLTEAV
ncbi:threonine ammonia-lyase [Rugosimonospora africana]|uniref:Threonine ammonia-lyase n=1 Tax=Rugosimonospora africana TaxID=556532 RepID=A0A8J3R2M8_9ACTN|nr:threonine/serine dehydratase [Rugosimonospora africana]GIH20752.1 threonine ammonia-lyase [Rugosimonospora africana]